MAYDSKDLNVNTSKSKSKILHLVFLLISTNLKPYTLLFQQFSYFQHAHPTQTPLSIQTISFHLLGDLRGAFRLTLSTITLKQDDHEIINEYKMSLLVPFIELNLPKELCPCNRIRRPPAGTDAFLLVTAEATSSNLLSLSTYH